MKKFKRPFLALHHNAWLIAAHFLTCVAMMFLLLGHQSHAKTVNVIDFGAIPSDNAEDTYAINTAISQIKAGDAIFIPKGTYLIDSTKSVRLRSNMAVFMDPGAYLKELPNNSKIPTAILLISNVENITVIGGTIQGLRLNKSRYNGVYIRSSKNKQ